MTGRATGGAGTSPIGAAAPVTRGTICGAFCAYIAPPTNTSMPLSSAPARGERNLFRPE